MSTPDLLSAILFVLLGILSVTSAHAGLAVASRNGRQGAGFLLGLLLGPLGALLAGLLGPEEAAPRRDHDGPGMR